MTVAQLSKKERYLLTVRREETDHPPAWIMRQAGRYMPEYRALRERYSFRDLCLNADAAAEASFLPLQLLDVDVLIIFNDILTPLEEMGIVVEFPDGGPRIVNPVRGDDDMARLRPARFSDPPVAKSIRRLRELAGDDAPILGFCGSPFTLACYMVEGQMSRNQSEIKRLRFENPNLLHGLLDRLTETAAGYLIAQIDAGGADGVQVFESWGGVLAAPRDYEEFAAVYQRRLISKVKAACPGTPIQLYVRGSAPVIESMSRSGADVISIDWSTPLGFARERTELALQGNLDPMAMLVPQAVEDTVSRMLEGFDWRRGWIANLGHGITPDGTMDAARRFVEAIHRLGGIHRP